MPTFYIDKDTKLPERKPFDFYPTEDAIADLAIQHYISPMASFYKLQRSKVLDPGAGSGVWGRALRRMYEGMNIHGVEIRDVTPDVVYNEWYNEDFLTWNCLPAQYNFIVGNPPYKFAEKFIRKSHHLLRHDGVMVMLLKLSFQTGQRRYEGFWRELPLYQLGVLARRPSFTGDGKTGGDEYGLYVWRKGYTEVHRYLTEQLTYERT
jgi:hypothetical protein